LIEIIVGAPTAPQGDRAAPQPLTRKSINFAIRTTTTINDSTSLCWALIELSSLIALIAVLTDVAVYCA